MRGRRGLAAVLLAVAGGLALTGSATASWATAEHVVEIGDVPVTEVTEHDGTAFAPLLIVWGITAAAGGVGLAALRGTARRVLGGAVAALGLVALADVARGAIVLTGAGASLDAGPGVGAVGAVAVLAGGALALRGDPPRLAERFDLDRTGDAPEDEWALASDDAERDVIADRDGGGEPGSGGEPGGGRGEPGSGAAGR